MRRITIYAFDVVTFIIAYKMATGLIVFITKDMGLFKLRRMRKEHEKEARQPSDQARAKMKSGGWQSA